MWVTFVLSFLLHTVNLTTPQHSLSWHMTLLISVQRNAEGGDMEWWWQPSQVDCRNTPCSPSITNVKKKKKEGHSNTQLILFPAHFISNLCLSLFLIWESFHITLWGQPEADISVLKPLAKSSGNTLSNLIWHFPADTGRLGDKRSCCPFRPDFFRLCFCGREQEHTVDEFCAGSSCCLLPSQKQKPECLHGDL